MENRKQANYLENSKSNIEINSVKEKAKKNSKNKGITLIALVVTILLSYDDIRKYSNSSKFLLPINC